MTARGRLPWLLLLLAVVAWLAFGHGPEDPAVRPKQPGVRVGALPSPAAQADPAGQAASAPDTDRPAPAGTAGPVPLRTALDLFGPAVAPAPRSTPAPPPPTVPAASAAEPAPPPPPPVRPRGVFSEPGKPARVLLEDSRGDAWLVAAGASLDGAALGWLVEALEADAVVLRHRDGGQRHRLLLPIAP